MGNPSSKSAQMGNVLTARTMILLLVASALGVWVVLEQPSTSLMEFHVLFQRFLKLVPMRVLSIQMADYGSPTSKPTLLYSSNLANNMHSTSFCLQGLLSLACVSNSLAQGKAICEFHLVSFKVMMLSICCHPTKPKGSLRRKTWFVIILTVKDGLVYVEVVISKAHKLIRDSAFILINLATLEQVL